MSIDSNSGVKSFLYLEDNGSLYKWDIDDHGNMIRAENKGDVVIRNTVRCEYTYYTASLEEGQ